MSAVGIELGRWHEMQPAAAPIRLAVFVDEQQVPVELEWDEYDAVSTHAIARKGGQSIGTARLLPDGHIGRMAVLAAHRGQGVGAALLTALIERAREVGLASVCLHAQTHARAFYERHGFVAQGAVFIEAGIPHVMMSRVL